MKNSMGVEDLEERLRKLEERLFGNNDPQKVTQPVVETLSNIHSKIQSATGGKEKIATGLKKVNEMQKMIDVQELDRATLSDAAKLEFVLAEEDRVRQTLDSLQKIEDLKYVLDSEHIKGAAGQADKLMALSQVQLAQQQHADTITEEVERLLLQYNDIVSTMTRQFVLWDDILTKAEIQAQPKKVIN